MSNPTTLIAPQVLFTGKEIYPTSGQTKLVTLSNPGNNIRQINSTTFRQSPQLMFAKGVLVTMTSVYHLKDYADYKETPLEFIGNFLDPANINYAQINYTLNGKDPIRTKYHIYRKPFILNDNLTSDNTIIKARVYRQGIWSSVVEINVHLV